MMACPVSYSRPFAFMRGSKCVPHDRIAYREADAPHLPIELVCGRKRRKKTKEVCSSTPLTATIFRHSFSVRNPPRCALFAFIRGWKCVPPKRIAYREADTSRWPIELVCGRKRRKKTKEVRSSTPLDCDHFSSPIFCQKSTAMCSIRVNSRSFAVANSVFSVEFSVVSELTLGHVALE